MSKNFVIIALLAALTFASVRTLAIYSANRASGGIENRTEMFYGYDAFLDREINCENVQSWDMERTLNDNDTALWVQASPSELAVGDIVIYSNPSNPSSLIAHRIVEIDNSAGYKFSTKGDAASQADSYWVAGELKGIVIGVIYYRAP
jgi:signal peptidase I